MLSLLLTSLFTLVQINCENLFDTQHDEGHNDYEYLPTSDRKWDNHKYWEKLSNISRAIISCGEGEDGWTLPDMVTLCEVENDTVMRDLTRRSLLREAHYEYIMTESNDERGVDVALLYSPFSFVLLNHYSLRVPAVEGRHDTRDVLYAKGLIITGDTLHVLAVHAPSRIGGKAAERHRQALAQLLCATVDSIRAVSPDACILLSGDFNDEAEGKSLKVLSSSGIQNLSADARGANGARGTYKYKGHWGSLDHIFAVGPIQQWCTNCHINDPDYLLEEDEKYGGCQPRRTYIGHRYHGGTSDHLPLVATFHLPPL